MLSGGPWAQSIVEFEASTSAAFEAFLAAERCRAYPDGHYGILPVLHPKTSQPSSSQQRADRALGVQVDGQIQAIALFCLGGVALNKSLMRLYVGVAQHTRRQGMGTALFMRCVAIARQAGLRYLIIDDVDSNALAFARFAGAELLFVDGECQAWIELGAPTPTHETASFADLFQG